MTPEQLASLIARTDALIAYKSARVGSVARIEQDLTLLRELRAALLEIRTP